MDVADEVPIESFEGTTFPDQATLHVQLRYVDRLLHIVGSVDTRVHGECDSCLEGVDREIHIDVDERFDPHAREDDPFAESNVLAGNRLDIADLAQQLVLSEMPMGIRCSESCKGLCGICGVNRNTGSCSCETNGENSGKSQVEDAAQ